MTTLFRALILASAVLYAVGWWFPRFDASSHPYEWQVLLHQDGNGALISMAPWMDLLLFTVTIAISALLFFFVRFARRAYLLLVLAYSASAFIWGLRVTTPMDEFVASLVGTLDGVILTMAYLTSVAGHFEKGAAQPALPAEVNLGVGRSNENVRL